MNIAITTPDTPMQGYIDNTVQVGQVINVGNRQYAVSHIQPIESGEHAAIWLRPVDYHQHADAGEFADAIADAITAAAVAADRKGVH